MTPPPPRRESPVARQVSRDSPARRFIVDIGAAASRRHAIPAWFTADRTDVLPRLDGPAGGTVTTYVIATVARAVARQPRLHALLDLRGRVVTFASVDVTVSVEVDIDGQPFPMNNVLRGAHARSLPDLLRTAYPCASVSGQSTRTVPFSRSCRRSVTKRASSAVDEGVVGNQANRGVNARPSADWHRGT